MSSELTVQIPEMLSFLFEPHRHKIARGGRGSAKSWSFARALLLQGRQAPLRILCAREVQESIKESVHRLLSDQIVLLGLENFYYILKTEIRGKNGTLFSFVGLSELTVTSIKSYEGYDICWVEEGQTISDRSWRILLPTIRKEGSEIWVSYNPDLESDPTHQRFTINPPDDIRNVLINHRDNPWLTGVSEQERLHAKKTDPDNYMNIWEGECRPAVEGAIYFKEIAELERNRRVMNLPYDPMLKVHVVMDVGGDALTAALVQRNLSEIRIIEYIEASHTKLDVFSSVLRERRYNWGRLWLPHDAWAKRVEAHFVSTADTMIASGWDAVGRDELTELTIEEGIKQTRLAFPRMYFDKIKTATPQPFKVENAGEMGYSDLHWRMLEALKRYRRNVNPKTEVAGSPVKDPNVHAADTLRYLAININQMLNETIKAGPPPGAAKSYGVQDKGVGI